MRVFKILLIGVIVTLVVVLGDGCKYIKLNSDGNDIHNLEGISEFVEKINSVIPYTSYDLLIGNSISFLHANNVYVSKRKLLTKSLNSVEIGDIIGEVTSYEDSTHSITLDTFGLHYYVMVSADTSFGSIFFTSSKEVILMMNCKVFKDSLGQTVEDAAIISGEKFSQQVLAQMVRINDSIIKGRWLLRDTMKGVYDTLSATINLEEKEVPSVYNNMTQFFIDNRFVFVDSSFKFPVEVIDEFLKEVYGDEKATGTGSAILRAALSGAVIYVLITEFHINVPTNLFTAAGLSALNELLFQMMESLLSNPPPASSTPDWDMYWRMVAEYLRDLGFTSPPPPPFCPEPSDNTYWWWYGQHG